VKYTEYQTLRAIVLVIDNIKEHNRRYKYNFPLEAGSYGISSRIHLDEPAEGEIWRDQRLHVTTDRLRRLEAKRWVQREMRNGEWQYKLTKTGRKEYSTYAVKEDVEDYRPA
jgi:hypothetical protein